MKTVLHPLTLKQMRQARFNVNVPMGVQISAEHKAAIAKMDPECVNAHAHAFGLAEGEPLTVMAEALLQYAKDYQRANGSPLAEDGYTGRYWLEAAKAVRYMLSATGGAAMRFNRGTDSFDGGTLCELLTAAQKVAGFPEDA